MNLKWENGDIRISSRRELNNIFYVLDLATQTCLEYIAITQKHILTQETTLINSRDHCELVMGEGWPPLSLYNPVQPTTNSKHK